MSDTLLEGGRPIRDLPVATQEQIDVIETETIEIDTHFHVQERWLGAGASTGMAGYSLTSGNDDWGSWVTLLDTGDTPIIAGRTAFDFRRVLFTVQDTAAVHRMQIGWGATGTIISGERFTEVMFLPSGIGANISTIPVSIRIPRLAAGTLVSARTWVDGENADGTTFFMGIHEYPL